MNALFLCLAVVFSVVAQDDIQQSCETLRPTISPKAISLLGRTKALAYATKPAVPDTINAIIYLLDFSACGGSGPAVPEQTLSSFLFGRDASTPTLEAHLRFCSHGSLSFGQKRVVTIPLKKCQFGSWSFRVTSSGATCPSNAIYDIANEASSIASSMGIDVTQFDYQWMVLDKSQRGGEGCSYMGLATLGRDVLEDGRAVGRLFIAPIVPWLLQTQVWVHEIGHNLGLLHSSSTTGPYSPNGRYNEYGDGSCALGGLNFGDKCYNAAHSTILGWNTPQVTYELTAVPNRWTNIFLYRPQNADTSAVLVYSGSGSSRKNWFISFRTRDGNTKYRDFKTDTRSPFNNDNGVELGFAPAVHIHTVNNEMTPSNEGVIIVGMLKKAGDKWSDSTAGLRVRYTRLNVNPIIHICRPKSANDCQ